MKRVFCILLLVLTLSVTACSSSESAFKSKLVNRKWSLASGSIMGVDYPGLYFLDDGTIEVKDEEGIYSEVLGTYTISDVSSDGTSATMIWESDGETSPPLEVTIIDNTELQVSIPGETPIVLYSSDSN